MTNKEITKQPQSILSLLPPDLSQIHPYAKERFIRFFSELSDEVPTKQLSNEDFTAQELDDFAEYKHEIMSWLDKCRTDVSEATLMVYPYSSAVNYYMRNLKELIKTVFERKMEKARREAAEKERQAKQKIEERRRLAAIKEINPPIGDAKRFLTEAEYKLFVEGLPGAISAFLDGGKGCLFNDWQFDTRASNYVGCLGIIKRCKEEESRRKQAQLERDKYINRLSLAIEKVKAGLAYSKEPAFVYPPELEEYQPDGWCELRLPTIEEIQNWAGRVILDKLPEILVNLTGWELTSKVWVLPRAAYQASDVPCLRWHFDGYVLVTAVLELKAGVIRKHRPGGYSVEVQAKGEKLGTIYLPREWSIPGSFATPVPLIRMLVEGGLEAPGISVKECCPPFTTFSIQGFDEVVEVYDDFVAFVRDIGKEKPLAEALLERGLVDKNTAELLKKKWDLSLPVGSGPHGSNFESESAVNKLTELGLSESDAKKAVENATIPDGSTAEEIVGIVLAKS